MNLVEIRNKASQAMTSLHRKAVRVLEFTGDDIGRNGTEVTSFVEDILKEWDAYSELKRQVASVRSSATIKSLGISFTEADIICRDIDDQIEFLDAILDKIDVRIFDSEGNPASGPHVLIVSLRSKVEELSQLKAKIRSASESCEHEVNIAWYEDEEVEDLMKVSVSKREPIKVQIKNKPSGDPKGVAPKEPAPLPVGYVSPQSPGTQAFDPNCPICVAEGREAIEGYFKQCRYNVMTTLDRAISFGLLPHNTVPNDMRSHFDKHVNGIAEMEER